jgi:hypothetical protein
MKDFYEVINKNMKQIYSFFFVAACCCINHMSIGQQAFLPVERHTKVLQRYENLMHSRGDSGVVVYEQRLYRNPLVGMLLLSRELADSTATYVPLFQGVPVAGYRMKNGRLSTSMLEEQQAAIPFSAKRYLLDWWIEPLYRANYGNFNHPIESKTSILLNTQVYIRKGLVIQGGIVFPIINDLDTQTKSVRLGPVFANQFMSLGKSQFLSISAGMFYNDRMGLSVQYRKADLNKPWSYGVEGAVTRFYYIQNQVDLLHGIINDVNLLADVSYRIAKWDMLCKLTAGQFMYKDKGLRFDLVRQFSTVDIGFFVIKTGNGSNLGFNFSIPLFSDAILKTRNARLRFANEFKYEYNYTRGYQIGERFRTGYSLEEKLRQYHHDYWQSQYNRIKKQTR